MRNPHAGTCYRCGEWVPKGEGFFEKNRMVIKNEWRVVHSTDCHMARAKKAEKANENLTNNSTQSEDQ